MDRVVDVVLLLDDLLLDLVIVASQGPMGALRQQVFLVAAWANASGSSTPEGTLHQDVFLGEGGGILGGHRPATSLRNALLKALLPVFGVQWIRKAADIVVEGEGRLHGAHVGLLRRLHREPLRVDSVILLVIRYVHIGPTLRLV